MALTINKQHFVSFSVLKAEVITFTNTAGTGTTLTFPLKFIRDIKGISYASDSTGTEKFHTTTTANSDILNVVMTISADANRRGCIMVVGF